MGRYQPALLGGVFVGVFSSLPVVSAANLCCCLWVVAGGILTTYLQQQNRGGPIEAGDAAVGGLMAGTIGAVLYLIVIGLTLSGTTFQEQFRALIDSSPELPVQVRDSLTNIIAGRNMIVAMGAVTLPTYAFSCMLGGLLGTVIFRKAPPPAQNL